MAVIGTCQLCLQRSVELRDSHLLSKAAYKILRNSQDGDSPIMVDREIALVTDSQVRGHVLCDSCEDLLNKNGERWVLRNCHRGAEGFRLRELLHQTQPEHRSHNFTMYAATKIPEIDVDKLAYFGASVFWRSCVHEWRSRMAPVNFGEKYEREFRECLLGSDSLPRNAALWVHVTNDQLAGYMSVPAGGRLENYWRYDFNFLGIGFTLWLGSLIPEQVRRFCFVRSPEHFISSGNVISDMIIDQAGKLFGRTKPVGSLARFEEEHFTP